MATIDDSVPFVDVGSNGVRLRRGDHVCVFYRGRSERDAVLLPFIDLGIERGEKVLGSVHDRDDGPGLRRVRERIAREGLEGTGQVTLLDTRESYLKTGTFSEDATIEMWTEAIETALDDGYDLVRAFGEMSWAEDYVETSTEAIMRYERGLKTLRKYAQVTVCLYDLDLFDNGAFLLEVLRTHPLVLMGGQLIQNPWYEDY